MSLNDLVTSLKSPQPDIVDRDLPCQTCGYNLRTLSAASLCPECGSAVSLSFNENLLADAHPPYVLHLARGATWTLRGILIMLAACIIGFGATRRSAAIAGSVSLIALHLGIILVLVGDWNLTAPDPQTLGKSLGENRCRASRRIVRISIAIFACCECMAIFFADLDWTGRSAPQWMPAIEMLASVVALVGFIAQMRYMRHLAVRMADQSQAQLCRLLGRLGALAGSVTLLGGWWEGFLLKDLIIGPRWTRSEPVYVFIMIVSSVTVYAVVMGGWAISQLARGLREEARIAQRRYFRGQRPARRKSMMPRD